MDRVLATNVYDAVSERWFGPAYNNADRVPEDVAERFGDHVWATGEALQAAGVSESETEPESKPLDKMSKGELVDLVDRLEAEGTTIELPDKATKAQILEALQAAGVEG